MTLRTRLAAAALLVLLAACSTPTPPAKSTDAEAMLQGDAVVVDGSLRPDTLARVQAAVGERKISRLIIRSGGGEVLGSMKLARWVRANAIDVEVDRECFSSCANYVFPAGRNKFITGRGLVAWHGSIEHLVYLHDQGLRKMDAESLPSLREIVATERAFYSEMGINSFTAWFGKVAPYNVYNMYFMSKEDMEYFGMRDLHVRGDYLATDLSTYNKYNPNVMRLLAVDRKVTTFADPRWLSNSPAPPAPR